MNQSGKLNSMFGTHRLGENSAHFINGDSIEKSQCIDCKKDLSIHSKYYGSNHCRSCGQKYKFIIHPELITAQSLRMKERLKNPRNHPRFGKIPKPIERIKYKEILMRSSWEVKYAKYLDESGIKWLYESKTFDLGNCTYTPDFYLLSSNSFVEIKGWMRPRDLKKINLFRKKYPQTILVVLNRKELKELRIL
jgi:hypothetical protein